jgi:hypothetical protein
MLKMRLSAFRFLYFRHCERSEAIQCSGEELDCFVASLLAMTGWRSERSGQQKAGTTPAFSDRATLFALHRGVVCKLWRYDAPRERERLP